MRSVPLELSSAVSPILTRTSSCLLKGHHNPIHFRKLPSSPCNVSGSSDELFSLSSSILSKSALSNLQNKGTFGQADLLVCYWNGVCKASQVADLFPALSPEIVVREARVEDLWEVVETHCSSFFPDYSFPLDFVLRIDRLLAMLMGFSLPSGCKRSCLVAIIGSSLEENVFGFEDFRIGGFDGKFSLNKGYVAGILTVDTVADFLPRKGPLRKRRSGIAYVSNVAVRENYRRKGIAKRLIIKAVAHARSWGCRAIALHCDLYNSGATNLYKDQGFKSIKVPKGAKWPKPKTAPDVQFSFMMKLLNPQSTA